ncbi:Protein containing GIY-YIG catalytic domain protein [Ignavibacterium album JCM 16511]|uniref:Protein containing GIY-YIG catalytic domain protein n=1 Tax=Ignavibacterium album (strain DSM 19864 / JCM 16511 / NBRC 101810 / Mat9-16) TaxID=945713 RepID=I0ANT6_IGNAJ|nr:GIY-YIG nuclease family protein [Ignavibacterium album]AFH50643.1 Protein containing GIY-YIG catalytic domain protein [Ignavibacterium album JCM 16511]
MYFTYIIKSLKTNKFYFGHTQNLFERLNNHNRGKVRFTKPFRPWVIHYFESFQTRSDA